MKKNLAILDVETGGFSTEKNGVCEIALLIVNPETLEVVKEYSTLIKPYTRADDTDELVSYKEDSMAVHGITIEDLENEGLDVTQVMEAVLGCLEINEVDTIVGHNVKAFDIKKVEHLTKRFLGISLEHFDKYCTLEASRKHLNAKSHKLEDLCVQFKIVKKEAHRALNDCYNTLGLMRVLKEKGVLEI